MLENPHLEQLLQVGIRSVCPEEVEVARHDDRVRVWYSEELLDLTWMDELRARVAGRRVYLSIDVDGLDPAVVPATGTPEPDGLSWTEALGVIRLLADEAEIVGIDCVELAPREGLHHADFAVAKLLYKAISYAMEAIVEALDDEDDASDDDPSDDQPVEPSSPSRRRLPPLSLQFR
jgi:agmatinase